MTEPAPTSDETPIASAGWFHTTRERFQRVRALAEPVRRWVAKVSRVLFLVHCVVGPVVILWLALEPAARIGEGRLEELMRSIALFDFRWWIVLGAALGWALPLLLAVAYVRARHSMVQLERLKEGVGRLLRDTSIPVVVDVNHTVPVDIGHPLRCPVKMDASLTLEREVEVAVDIPVSLSIPVETVVETKVLGLGTISIPIKSEIPIDLVYPFRNTVNLKVENMPLTIEEEADVVIPVMEVPMQFRMETHLDLMSNLAPLRHFLLGGEVPEEVEETAEETAEEEAEETAEEGEGT